METETLTTRTCSQCKRTCMPASQWRKLTPAQLEDNARQGIVRFEARGLCQRCYRNARLDGTAIDRPRKNWTSAEVLEEWDHLKAPGTPMRRQVRNAAPRLGLSVKTLEAHLRRAGITSEYGQGGKTRKDGCSA